MGQPTVKLVHRTWEDYEAQVEADVKAMDSALMLWLEGRVSVPSPQLPDAADLRKLVHLRHSDDYEYTAAVQDLARKRQAAAVPAASTVGVLIAKLQGLDPELPISVVAGWEGGHIDMIEVPPLA